MSEKSKLGRNLSKGNFFNSFLLTLLLLFVVTIEFSAVAYADDAVLASNYLGMVCKKMREHWHPPANYRGESLVVSFRVHRDGSISNLTCRS